MQSRGWVRISGLLAIIAAASLVQPSALAATKTVDLDAQAANGSESQCDLNVLSTFPVKIENKVTNKALGDAFNFSWPSAGPGGFTSSVPAGTSGGVGAIWTWTTSQTVYSYTGNGCGTDICFAQTAGATTNSGYCSAACLLDGASLTVGKGTNPGDIALSWAGGQPSFSIYRSTNKSSVFDTANLVGTTDQFQFTDVPPAGQVFFYAVRGIDCATRKACSADSDCSAPGDGTCVMRGPFGVPGRSLYANDVTVSSASLTSSLITFFSPPKEIFRVTSTARPGGVLDTQQNSTGNPVTVTNEAYPPGCCEEPHRLNCGGECVEYLTDPNNCGACGNVCGPGTCCTNAQCLALCPDGYTFCPSAGLCFDLQNDPDNCGACGNVCGVDNICTGGACIPCGNQGGARFECDNRCTNLNTDPFNCGTCGTSCNLSCPSGFHGVCSNGQSCRCEAGPPSPRPPSNDPEGVAPGCPNPPPPPPPIVEAPVCEIKASSETIAPGGSVTTCRPSGVLYKEVPTALTICGDNIPGKNGQCAGAAPHQSIGTVMRLLPDTSKSVGNAYVTPYAVHVVSDSSSDGLISPGETASLAIEVLNAGPLPIVAASAQLVSPPVDLTQDGIDNPVAVTIATSTSSYGTIAGTTASGDCSNNGIQPATNAVLFQVTLPANHPADTSRPFTLEFTGTVDGAPYSMSVPIGLGIADRCDPTVGTRDYDGIDGLSQPMAKLVPTGDPVPFPSKALNAGKSAPLKARMFCGGVDLKGSDVDAPEIVGLSELTRGPLDISQLSLNDDTNSNDPFFRYNTSTKQWIYNMRTSQIGTGTFTLTIRIAGRKDYVTGFVLD